MHKHVVNIGHDFSRYPAGRFPTDGKYNGETFRKRFLLSAITSMEPLKIILDDAIHYGSSFLEESFGGLVRVEHLDNATVLNLIELDTEDDMLKEEIIQYIKDAKPE